MGFRLCEIFKPLCYDETISAFSRLRIDWRCRLAYTKGTTTQGKETAMMFWRKSKNAGEQDKQDKEDKVLHRRSEPALEPVIEDDPALPAFDESLKDELSLSEAAVIEEMKPLPVPEHTRADDAREREDLSDHSSEGGWFSRLTSGLSKSANKIAQGLTDVLTKSKIDAEALGKLEDLLLTADLGPQAAGRIIEEFSDSRFGKEITEEEVKQALAASIERILEPVAKPLVIEKPEDGPFVILVCGVNGAGKTTTIGKLAYHLELREKKKVTIAAADTFRAAAIEQLQEWGRRAHCPVIAKEIGADAAAVAFEAYAETKKAGRDVLIIDTAGRLQNKKNLMEELEKVIRVLKKQDSALPHAVLLVLDATTGQNAFSQVETFKEMVKVTGLAVTKLDGSAKGGVLVGLADKFGIPVHLIGVGEGIEDMQPFSAGHYAKSLVGLKD
jgi:fused signal recognition particle receptor